MRLFFTLCLAAIASITTLSAQQIVADGGLTSAKAPANTIAALEAASKAGYAVKCDVNLLNDGTIVVVEGPWLGEKGDPDRMNTTMQYLAPSSWPMARQYLRLTATSTRWWSLAICTL